MGRKEEESFREGDETMMKKRDWEKEKDMIDFRRRYFIGKDMRRKR